MKKISVLGSTGSIGTQTLDVVRKNNDIEVVAMAAGRRIKEMEAQIREFRPKLVSVADEQLAKELAVSIADLDVKIVYGMEGLTEAAVYHEAQTVVTAVVGMMGIVPTI
ncbi:MAG: 1-deoxy-D-xylulose-5-phosphate reductoisomerase, partial [Clostridia bacterium]|nr:1-deoxy-D-xylulose-5-phosphate reductoisomerase [Clostridia bacterium]